jgi:tetratricopeptide (TPR) repeat protein
MALQRVARVMGALIVVSASALEAQAQQRPLRPGQTPGPNFLVPGVLRGADKVLGQQVADAIRDRLMNDKYLTEMRVISKKDLVANLEQSGYSVTSSLTENDMKALALFIRAEEYIDGTVTRAEDGTLTLQAFLLLGARAEGMEQPLPEVTGARAGDLAARITRELDEARKSVKPANDCLTSRRLRNYEDAKMHAGKAISEYANSVFGRVCLLEVARDERAEPDTLIRIAEQILAIHPGNQRALEIVVDAYAAKSANDPAALDKYIEGLQKLRAADPSNTTLSITVAEALARADKMELAKIVIDSTAAMSPGDPAVVSLQWRIYRSVGDWKGVARIGEDMARHDTAAADTAFWQQLVAAYVSDSQPVKAQEAASRGTAKFPNNVTLWLSVAQLARTNGQLPQALEATNRILQIDPQNSPAALQKAQIYSELDQVDSMVVALRAADAVGAPKETVAGMALSKANTWFRTWNADSAKTIEEGERILPIITFSDSLNQTPGAALLTGFLKLTMGNKLVTEAREPRNCEMATKGKMYLAGAQEILPRAGRDFPEQVGQVMQQVMALNTYADQLIKAICPGGR